jgi:hypothetical protein
VKVCVVVQPVSWAEGPGHTDNPPEREGHVGEGGSGMAQVFLGNAFSLSMLPPEGATVKASPLTVEEAKALLAGGYISAVGHESTAAIISLLVGVEVPTNRIAIRLSRGDRLIVFQIGIRLAEGQVLSQEEVANLVKEGKATFWLVEVLGQ